MTALGPVERPLTPVQRRQARALRSAFTKRISSVLDRAAESRVPAARARQIAAEELADYFATYVLDAIEHGRETDANPFQRKLR